MSNTTNKNNLSYVRAFSISTFASLPPSDHVSPQSETSLFFQVSTPCIIAQGTFATWLVIMTDNAMEKYTLCWALIHLCLGMHQTSGLYLVEDDFDLVFLIVQKYKNDLVKGLRPQVIFYIYHFAVGRYGRVIAEQGCGDVLQNTITALENEEQGEVDLEISMHLTVIPHQGLVCGNDGSVVSADVEDVNAD